MSMAARHARSLPLGLWTRALATEQLQFHGAVKGRRRDIPSLVALWLVVPCYHVLMFTTRSDITGTSGAVSDLEEFCISVPLVKHHRPMPKRQKILSSCIPVHMVCKFLSWISVNFSTEGGKLQYRKSHENCYDHTHRSFIELKLKSIPATID